MNYIYYDNDNHIWNIYRIPPTAPPQRPPTPPHPTHPDAHLHPHRPPQPTTPTPNRTLTTPPTPIPTRWIRPYFQWLIDLNFSHWIINFNICVQSVVACIVSQNMNSIVTIGCFVYPIFSRHSRFTWILLNEKMNHKTRFSAFPIVGLPVSVLFAC